MSDFVHLHVHTQFSLLDGAARISDLVSRAKALGMQALAITDHGVMYGVIDFYKECVKQGIKPILGIETYVVPRSHRDKDTGRDSAHLVLLAKNEMGYKNLLKLSSIAFIDGFYYKPRIDYDLLEEYSEGLVCLSACIAGDIPQYLLAGRYDEARTLALRLKGMFNDDFYIELQNHGLEEQQAVLPRLKALADELNIKTVATNDIHYVNKDDAEAQDVLLCVQTNKFVDDENRMKMSADEFYLKNEEEMRQALFAYQDSLVSTKEIADKCNVEIRFGQQHMPGFTAPDGRDNLEYLTWLSYEGLKRKMPNADDAARERLQYEIDIISRMGFVDYFLIVWDFVDYAHRNGIFVGPGRGSGAASLVAYSLAITDVDPLKYDLPFERFLNPERISMPDFDIDFCIERRQEVIDYVIAKYGKDNVAQIITFGSMAARMVVRDVGRALHIPLAEVDKIAKMIPGLPGTTLEKALELSDELRMEYRTNERVKKLIDLSLKLEGLPRHASTHAAGIVISAEPTSNYVPLQRNDEAITTQFPMTTIEELGLLKMDFLGLRTLTVIRDALDYIRAGGKGVPDLESMAFDDAKIFEMIAAADTDGVFQLESAGMRQFMLQLKPDCIEDVIDGIALFRPGPMDQIPRYVANKHNKKKITYLHEKLRPSLESTYGCMVYQEQVMRIVRDVAGYSMGRSDLVRRAMSKKKHDVMAQERKNFIHGIVDADGTVSVPGAVRNGVSEKIANQIFDEMSDFASYAFNKPHAAGYAIIAYRTAYLKLHYPVEFLTATINSFLGSISKMADYIGTARRSGISVLPPDINKSVAKFSCEGNNIRVGLAAIKNVGASAMDGIIHDREQNGKFVDFEDFVKRSDGVNKRMLEAMIKVGCFDSMGVKRSQLMVVYEQVMAAVVNERKQSAQGQFSLFDMLGADAGLSHKIPMPNMAEYDKSVILAYEREALGIYLSGHPLLEYEDVLRSLKDKISVLNESGENRDGERVRVGGIITHVQRKATKSGNGIMGYCTLEDLSGTIELLAFPSVFTKYTSLLVESGKVIASGRLSVREDQATTILVDEVVPLTRSAGERKLYLRLELENEELCARVLDELKRYPGNVPVLLCDMHSKKTLLAPKELYANTSGVFLDSINKLLGEENVKLN